MQRFSLSPLYPKSTKLIWQPLVHFKFFVFWHQISVCIYKNRWLDISVILAVATRQYLISPKKRRTSDTKMSTLERQNVPHFSIIFCAAAHKSFIWLLKAEFGSSDTKLYNLGRQHVRQTSISDTATNCEGSHLLTPNCIVRSFGIISSLLVS